MTRRRVENREGSLGYPGFVKPVFTKDSKHLGKRKRSLGYLGIVTPVLTYQDNETKLLHCHSSWTITILKIKIKYPVALWIADTRDDMDEWNACCDPSLGWRESYQGKTSKHIKFHDLTNIFASNPSSLNIKENRH
ncbi:hypothetical protein TNCV_1099451 [Trichonephila clavipes]|nr:hypothetical protein TNCV_1099451 [Trichonephila clavipes]